MSDFVEPSMVYTPEKDNFEEPSFVSEDSFKLPDYAKDIDPIQALRIGTGRGLNRAYRGVKDLVLAGGELLGNDYSKNARQQMREEGKQNDKYWNDGIANKLSPVSGYAKTGQFIGEVAPGLALPASRAATLLGRAGVNAGIAGAYEAGTTEGSAADRGLAGATGAIGAGLGSAGMEALIKPVKGYMGNWGTKGSARDLNEKLTGMGLSPRVGDLDKTATLMGMAENLHSHLPTGASAFSREKEKLRRLIVPDKVKGTNAVTEAVNETNKAMNNASNEIWKPFEDFVSSNPALPGLRPNGLKTSLTEILRHDPSFVDKIPDQVVRDQLQFIVDTPMNKLKSIPVLQYHELRKSLGGLTPSIKAISTPVPGSTKMADRNLPRRFAKLLDGTSDDLNTWGGYKSVGQGKQLFDDANKQWKEMVLPWKESDIVYDLKQVAKHGAPDTARIVTNPDTDKVDLVRQYLSEYGPYDASNVVDAISTMNRHGAALGKVDEGLTHSSSLTAAGLQEMLAAVVAPTAMLSGTRFGKNAYFGNAVPEMTSALGRFGIGSARESGPELASVIALIKELGGSSDEDDKGMGVQTQDSFRNPGRFNQQ
jgi:hypothetical protein